MTSSGFTSHTAADWRRIWPCTPPSRSSTADRCTRSFLRPWPDPPACHTRHPSPSCASLLFSTSRILRVVSSSIQLSQELPHLRDLSLLARNDRLAQLPNVSAPDRRFFAHQDSARMMGNHRSQELGIRDCCLLSDER